MDLKKSLFEKVNCPEDIKNFNSDELIELCGEVRIFLIESISKTGGHLGSNLGIVELTVSLHKVFDSPKDKIIFDVGHQCYVHKILTGRKNRFGELRKLDGLSGFAKPSESEHDIFGAGHSSTSISAAIGINKANRLEGKKDDYVIAVIGDGSFTGGLVYEALNNIKDCKNLIVILNDNEMSISRNVGSMAEYLAKIRTAKNYFSVKRTVRSILSYIPFAGRYIVKFIRNIKKVFRRSLYKSTFFEQMGFDFLGPVDGHDVVKLLSVLNEAKTREKPVFIHIKTQKGKGYEKAEANSTRYHHVGKFDAGDGIDADNKADNTDTYSSVCGKYLSRAAEYNSKICAVTAAMADGTGLTEFSKRFPERFFDVGIAESHAVIFSAGLASQGFIPVFCVYSSFLQRAYDQIIHDITIQKLHAVICIDRAGLVGEDGVTHHGVFDVPFLNHIPDIIVYSPLSFRELEASLDIAIYKSDCPVFVRYPKGSEDVKIIKNIEENKNLIHNDSNYLYIENYKKATYIIAAYGKISSVGYDLYEKMSFENISVNFLKINKIKPIETDIINLLKNSENIIFIEECMKAGGIGTNLSYEVQTGTNINFKIYALEKFTEHGTIPQLLDLNGLTAQKIYDNIFKKQGKCTFSSQEETPSQEGGCQKEA